MALRAEYSLGHSEYNAFLFAAVGEEKTGMPLTVLTALARLGVDPWQEAARLADLSKEAAQRTFAATIAKLPEGDWKASDSEAIARRLLSWLPGRGTKTVPATEVERPTGASDKTKSRLAIALFWGGLATAFLLLTLYFQADRTPEPAPRAGTTTQQ